MTIRWLSNAGIFAKGEAGSVLVDGLHGKVPRFSATPPELAESILAGEDGFSSVDLVIATHQHQDHWDAALVRNVLEAHPEATLAAPVLPSGGPRGRMARLEAACGTLEVGAIRVDYLRVPHEGARFAHVPNYACRVWLGDGSLIVTGDAAISETGRAVGELTGDCPADAVFVDFPLLTLAAGRRQLAQMPAGRLYAFHLPFEEDDEDGFRESAKRALERSPVPIVLLLDSGWTETL